MGGQIEIMMSEDEVKKPSLWSLMAEDVSCVFKRDPAARNKFEVLTTYPGVHAILMYRLAHSLWQRGWRYAGRFVSFIVRVWTNIDIHPGATIGSRFFIDHGAGVVIGETAVVGDDVTLYHGVTLGGTTWNKGKRHPTLGNGVMVGAGAKVLGAITLGEGARVGANSVVVNNVPAARSVVGIPGRIVQIDEMADDNIYGIDLNHHLIPDPVGKAISCLLDRIQQLESQLHASGFCDMADGSCEADDVCHPKKTSQKNNISLKKMAGGK